MTVGPWWLDCCNAGHTQPPRIGNLWRLSMEAIDTLILSGCYLATPVHTPQMKLLCQWAMGAQRRSVMLTLRMHSWDGAVRVQLRKPIEDMSLISSPISSAADNYWLRLLLKGEEFIDIHLRVWMPGHILMWLSLIY